MTSESDATRPPDDETVASSLYLALGAGRYEEAIALAEEHWPILIGSRPAALRAVADALPAEVVAAHPSWERIRRYLGFIMMDAAVRPDAFVDVPPRVAGSTLVDRLVELTSRSVAARTGGHIAEALRLARQAQRTLEGASVEARRALENRLADAFFHWAMSFEFAGLEPESLTAFETAYNLAVAYGNNRVACDAAGELAWLNALCGRGRAADEWIARAQATSAMAPASAPWRRTDVLASAVRAADRLRPDLALDILAERPTGGVDEHRLTTLSQSVIFRMVTGRESHVTLLSELQRALAAHAPLIAEPGENSIVMGYAEALLHLFADRPERALELLDDVAAHGGEPFVIGARANVHLAAGAADEAERDADRAIALYTRWPRVIVPALLVKAVLALDDGRTDRAADHFLAACALADENAIVSSVTSIPHRDYAALTELAGADRMPPQLVALGHTPLLFAPPRRMRAPLSGKELTVLRELSAGGSLAEIAARLFLSQNTLKAHTRSIYRKLGVTTREEALRQAHERGLV